MISLTNNQQLDIQLVLVMHLNDPIQRREDVRDQTILEILSGKPLEQALHHARAAVAIQFRSSAWLSLDVKDESGTSPYEFLAADEKDEMEKWRTNYLSPEIESLLSLISNGSKALSVVQYVGQKKVSRRRIQQKIKSLIELTEMNKGLWDDEDGEVLV